MANDMSAEKRLFRLIAEALFNAKVTMPMDEARFLAAVVIRALESEPATAIEMLRTIPLLRQAREASDGGNRNEAT